MEKKDHFVSDNKVLEPKSHLVSTVFSRDNGFYEVSEVVIAVQLTLCFVFSLVIHIFIMAVYIGLPPSHSSSVPCFRLVW